MKFVDQAKYVDCYPKLYSFVKDVQPASIVELGYGNGGSTVAMAYAVSEYSGSIWSCDTQKNEIAKLNLSNRNLDKFCNLLQLSINTESIQQIPLFDMLLIDIDNTWQCIYDIVYSKNVIECIQNGAHVWIEGGADSHPRINLNTLNRFHEKLGHNVFKFTHISGNRTSLSILQVL